MSGHAMSPLSTEHRLARGQARWAMGVAVAVALVLGAAASLRPGSPLQRFDHALLDTYLAGSASGVPARGTAVVDIDEASLAALGQWPWPRYRVAALIQRIAAAHPATIALDVLFPEADRASLDNIRQTFKRDFGVDVSFGGVPAGLTDNDGYLGQTIAQAGVVGARYFQFDHVTGRTGPVRAGLGFDGRTDLLALDDAPGVLENADEIASQTRVSGFVNSQPDGDGLLRRLPLLIRHAGVVQANLALAASMQALGVSTGTVESGRDGLALRIGTHRIPIDATGRATLRFNGAQSLYGSVCAVDVLDGRFQGDDLRGKIVFIGSSAVGLNDLHATAADTRFPGLKIQSVMAQDILDDDFVRVPAWAGSAIGAACVLVGVSMAGLFIAGVGMPAFAAASALGVAALAGLSVLAFAHAALFVSVAAPALVAGLLFVAAFGARFALERRRARRWRRQLENARQVTIESMASVAETRDPETGAHIKRTQNYVRAIAEQLQREGHHARILTKEFIQLLFVSAPLHDIGKVGVPDHILLKPGRLSFDEMEIMKRHAEFGRKIIFSTAERIEGDNFLVIAGEIAATHHEKWDGTGYPLGLSGQAIPLSGRIMAVADIYDALISRRCYKEPFTHEHSTSLMREMRGTTFDPVVLDAFFAIEAQILDIAQRFRDEAEPDIQAAPCPTAAARSCCRRDPAPSATRSRNP